MKRLFLFLALLLLIAVAAFFVFIVTFDANRYNSLLTQKIEEAIKKDVKIGNISLNAIPNLSLRIDGIFVKDPDKSWEDGILKASSIEASVKLLPLLRKDLRIERLNIRGLEINIEDDSALKIPSLDTGKDNSEVGLTSIAALKFLARSIFIIDSSISYKGVKVDIIEALFKNISLYGPVQIEATLSMFGMGGENMQIKTVLYPEIESKNPYLKNLELKIDLAKFKLKDALEAFNRKDIASQLIGKNIRGELFIKSDKVYLKPDRFFDSIIYLTLSDSNTDIVPIPGGIKRLNLEAELSKKDFVINDFNALVANGSMEGRGKIENIFALQESDLDLALKDIDVKSLMPDVSPGVPYLEGVLDIIIKSQSIGLEKDRFLNNLTAKGNLKLDRAVLRNLNLLTLALDKLDILPGLVDKLKDRLPSHYKELLKQDYTTFKPVDLDFVAKEGKAFLQDINIQSDAFYLKGSGYLGINGEIKAGCNLFIPKDVSASCVDVVEELLYLQNQQGMITMPVYISGVIPDVAIMPDLDYVIQRLAVSKGQELFDSIFRAEGQGQGEDKGGQNKEQGDSEEKQKPEPEEVLIKTIFDILTAPKQ